MKATQNTTDQKLFIGIDIHKRSWKIHTSTDLFDGKTLSVPPSALALKKYVDKHYPGYLVSTAYEAGCCGYRPHRYFESYGWHSIVFNPADLSRTGQSQYQKTDAIDARLIAKELKDQRLKSIHVPNLEREQFRSLFRRRYGLAKDLREIKTKIKHNLLFMGIEIPEEYDNPNWSKAFRKWIKELSFEYSPGQYTFESLLEQFEFLDQEIRTVSNQLRKYCRQNFKSDYNLLRSIPGIGPIVACGILAELGDLRRFSNAKHLAAYVGLIPSTKASGDKSFSPGMNPRSNRYMRSYFVEAAWQALRYDPVMQNYYREHQGKNPKAILVKVARKLLNRTLAVIKTQTPYQIGVVV
jgi:transposase